MQTRPSPFQNQSRLKISELFKRDCFLTDGKVALYVRQIPNFFKSTDFFLPVRLGAPSIHLYLPVIPETTMHREICCCALIGLWWVTLCNVIRYGGKTCFEMFHETEEMNDPYRVDGTPAKLRRAAPNLMNPPSRRRNVGDEPNNTENVGDAEPNTTGRQLQL